MNNTSFHKNLFVAALQIGGAVGLIFALSIGSVGAWNEPASSDPLLASLPGALNVGTKLNEKTGPLVVYTSSGAFAFKVMNGVVLVGVSASESTDDRLQIAGNLYLHKLLKVNGSAGNTNNLYLTRTTDGIAWQSDPNILSAGFGFLQSDLNNSTILIDRNQVQSRVTGTCLPGSAIRAVPLNTAGAITCE